MFGTSSNRNPTKLALKPERGERAVYGNGRASRK